MSPLPAPASADARTRICVAGAGVIGRAHMRAAQASGTVALCGIVDPSPAAAQLARDAGVPWRASLQEMLEEGRPDGVVLATPNMLHVPQALECLAAGLPVLVEKPVAATVAQGRALAEAARAGAGGRVPVLVGHHRAHSPVMAAASAAVRSGRLGRIVAVTGSATFYKPDSYFADAPWRSEPGGGPILLNLIHEVHSLRMLCGEIVAVQAFASRAVRGFAVEDTVAISLRFASGALGSFMLSDTAASPRSWEQTACENPAYDHHADEDCYVVSGTDGSLSVPTMRVKAYARPEDRSWYQPLQASVLQVARDDPIQRQMEHFGAVVRGQAQPLVTLRDGLANLRVTEAIALAAASGRTVAVDDDASAWVSAGIGAGMGAEWT